MKSRLCSPIFAVRSEAIVAARLWPVAALVLGRNPVFHLRSITIGRRDVQKFPMTAPGLQRLSDELRQLKAEERPSIIRQIAEAIRKTGRPIVLSLSPGPTSLCSPATVNVSTPWRP